MLFKTAPASASFLCSLILLTAGARAQSLDASLPAKEFIYSGSRLLAVVAQDNSSGSSGGGAYTTDHVEAFWAFDEDTGSTVYDQEGSADATIAGTPDWTTDDLGLYANNLSTGVTSFNGNALSAKDGEDYTIVWVGKLGTSTAYQTLWCMGLNTMVYFVGSPTPTFLVYVNGSSNSVSAAGLVGETVMITMRISGGGATRQFRIGTGSWQTLSYVGTYNYVGSGMLMGVDYLAAKTNTNLTNSLMWVYSDDLSDAELTANFDYAGAEIASRGGSLQGYTGSSSYTTDHVEAFWAFDEDTGSTVYDQEGSADATIAGTPDWTTDDLGLYANNLSTGVTSFNGNALSAKDGEDYTMVWVGKLGTSTAYQTLWCMGLNTMVYFVGSPTPTFLVYVNGYSNSVSAAGLVGETVMVTMRISGSGATRQFRIGTGSWQTLSYVGTYNYVGSGMLMGKDYNGNYTNTNLTNGLLWVYSDDLSDAELQANYDYADSVITARGGTLQ